MAFVFGENNVKMTFLVAGERFTSAWKLMMYNNMHRIFSALTNNGSYNPIYSYIEPESNHRQAVIPVADVGFEESIGNWLVIR